MSTLNLPLEFVIDGHLEVHLPSNQGVSLPICHPTFESWKGSPVTFDYGGKPIVDYQGQAVFAELAILRIMQASGWEGAWTETYGGIHYLQEMPDSWKLQSNHIPIPLEMEELLKKIWKAGGTSACFDVFAWKEGDIVFLEAKRQGKDRLTGAQGKFIESALDCGLTPDNLIIVEWNFSTAQ